MNTMAAKRKQDDALTAKDLAEDTIPETKPKAASEQQKSAASAKDAGITPEQLRYVHASTI